MGKAKLAPSTKRENELIVALTSTTVYSSKEYFMGVFLVTNYYGNLRSSLCAYI